MPWQYHPILIVFAIGGTVSLGVAAYCFQYMYRHGRSYHVGGISALAINTAIWSFAATLKTASATVDGSLFFYRFEYVASLNPAIGVVVALAYTGRDRLLRRELLLPMFLTSAAITVSLLMNLTNAAVLDPRLIPTQGVLVFEHDLTLIDSIYFAWTFVLVAASILIVTHGAVIGSVPSFPAAVAVIMLGLPTCTLFLKVIRVYPPGGLGINVTPAASAVSVSILAVAIVHFRVFDLIPIGRDRTVETMPLGYLQCNDAGRIVDANPEAATLLSETTASALVGRPLSVFFPDHDRWDRSPRTLTVGSRTLSVSRENVTRQQQANGHLFLFQDVTEQEARKRELVQYERVIENIPASIYRIKASRAGELVFGNSALFDTLGVPSIEAFSEYDAIDFYVDPADRDRLRERLLSDGKVRDAEVQLQRADGTQFWASISDRVVFEDDEPVYIEGAMIDITERKRYQRELEVKKDRIETERDGKEAVRQLLLQRATATEIAESACQLLVSKYGYAAAWVCRDEGTNGMKTVAVHGDDAGFRDTVGNAGDSPTQRVLAGTPSLSITVSDDDSIASHLAACGLHSVQSIQLERDAVSYRVLTVVRTEPGTEISQTFIDELGTAIAFKQRILTQQSALAADTLVDVELEVNDDTHPLAVLSVDHRLPAETILRAQTVLSASNGNSATLLVKATATDADSIVGAVNDVASILSANILSADEAEVILQLSVRSPTIASKLVGYGGRIDSITVTDGVVTVRSQLPPRTDVSAVVSDLRADWSGVSLRSRTERSPTTQQPKLFDSLTEKQAEALRVATFAGFFERPQRASGSDIADTLGVTSSTALRHIRAAERKVFDAAFKK
jgi:PAS domain S-box-containing protein